MMRPLLLSLLGLALSTCANATITQSHGYAQFGSLKYPARFSHFDWVNADAPKGGTLRTMAFGTFDTLNPYTFKGISPVQTANFLQYGINELNEPLMVGTGQYAPSGDEPTSSYGLIAQSVEYNESRSWVVFNLRPQARFNDGHPITSADVAFSYRTLLSQGHPMYRTNLQEVLRVDVLSPTRIRFVFKRSGNPLLILRLGELPILPKHYWQGRDFQATTFEVPVNSGPYRITQVVPGRRLVLERDRNWWGKDLPVNRGKYNFDRMEVEFYRDSDVAFEAFKAGEFDIYIEHQAKNWTNGYDFPAVRRGEVIKAQIPHKIPTQTQGLFFNTRRPAYSDPRVREALGLLLDFEWTNRALFSGAYRRTESYYPNSEFAATGLPSGKERLLLSAYKSALSPALFLEAPSMPATDGNGIPRATLRQALHLLGEAGWTLQGDRLRNAAGQPLRLEILLVNSNLERILGPYVANLASIGVQANLRSVDRAQYKQRLDQFDFDMISLTLPQTLSPGLEQWQYFHSSQAAVRGSKNYAGIANPVVDRLLEQLLAAQSRDDQVAAARALDRVLLSQHYMVANWYLDYHRLAYRSRLAFVTTPPYTLGLSAWWIKPTEKIR
ncbi:extracellular solute-binding protein [Pseudomonas coleopterorum]|uniref:Extracellular solute-binding protein n=1 Tax=Pseudomonas coleopterorum TaxID=1605838 RepID=A0AAJ6M2V0_9PSED|nr:extracellular solute-binding protein [Pseudomonas coleopterorum]WNC11356.1 extracellular solute-binding protein [Pseudomonas coleopterorum]